jgi:hypothetical protein
VGLIAKVLGVLDSILAYQFTWFDRQTYACFELHPFDECYDVGDNLCPFFIPTPITAPV